MQVKIRVLVGKNTGREIEIDEEEFIIGRGDGCHLRPKTDTVSRQHCALIVQDGKVLVRELGSKNGTTVNGVPLRADRELHDGDVVKAGKLEFAMVIAYPEGAARPSSSTSAADSTIARGATVTGEAATDTRKVNVGAGAGASGKVAANESAKAAAAPSASAAAPSASATAPSASPSGKAPTSKVKDVASRNIGRRTDGGQFEDDDVSDWLTESDTDERRRVADPETRQFRLDETDQITLSKAPSAAPAPAANTAKTSEKPASTSAAATDSVGVSADKAANPKTGDAEENSDPKAEDSKKGKQEPGKLPKVSGNSSKDSRQAAEQMLKKFFNRR